jgi:hypothetical protein
VFQSIGALLLISQTGYSAQKSAADVEPKVKTTLEKMVKYLESVENLAFTAASTTEDVSSTLQKLQSDTSLEAVLQYPNKVYFKKSGNEQMSLWFDGQTVTILDRTANKYSKVALVGSLQDLVNKLDDLGIEAPLAGILNRGILKHVEDHVFKGDHYGLTELDGKPMEHLALRQDSIDWQLWTCAETGAPKKVVITSKMLAGAPQHTTMISNVVVNNSKLQSSVFDAVIPANATEIQILGAGSEAINNSIW